MASQQPLVCTSLHLPPDLRPFLRIHEISSQVFLPNLDRLRLALEADRTANPEAVEIFDKTRKVSREELQKAFKVLHLGQEVAERYAKVLEALSERNPTHESLYNFHLGAYGAAQCSEQAQKAMNVFRGELESAVRQVIAMLDAKYIKGTKHSITSPENTQSVSLILNAIDECNELLQQCHDQFANLATQTRDKNSIDSNPPTEEEIQVMRAKWQTFFDNIRGVWLYAFKLANRIQFPASNNIQSVSETRKSRKKLPIWRTLFRRQDAVVVTAPSGPPDLQTNTINPENLTEGQVTSEITEVPDATPSNNPPTPKIPFWRRIFRRSKGNNSTPDDQQTRSKRWCF